MNKSELIDAVAAKVSELPKKAVGEVLNAFTATVGEVLKKGDDIALIGFGTFRVKERAVRTGVASAFCEHLACEHLEQPHGTKWRSDLPGENLFRGHWSAIILGIRIVSCANHCPFKGDTGKQTLAPAVGVDCGYWRDRNLRVPTHGPSGRTNATSQRYVCVSREGFHGGIRVEDHHEFRHLSTNLEAEARPTSANG